MKLPVFLGLLLAAGCGSAATPVTTLDDSLTAQDYDTTVQQLTALPWLPWGYTPDGCYARALYYSMLLATKGVPTNHLYVVARPGTSLGGQWRWHVAPVVTKDSEPDRLYVLDPVYDQTRALTNVEWVAKQFFPDPAATNYPSLHVREGVSYLDQFNVQLPLANPAAPAAETYKEPAFAAMPSFEMADVRAACDTMHRYIEREPNTTTAQKAEKHVSLGRETVRLVDGLVAKQKVSGEPTLPASCTRVTPFEDKEERDLPASDPTRF
jgi:hypothetical protein